MAETEREEGRTGVDWEQRFRDDHAPWERKRLHPAFEMWRDAGLFPAGASVFLPGCGRSPEPLAFAKLGLKVTCLDVAPTALAWQRAQFEAAGLTAEFVEADGLAWRPETPFDLYYEQTFLCAISPTLRADYERAAYEQLRAGGKLLALFMQKKERGGPPYGCDMEDMGALFSADRWDWPDGEFPEVPHPDLADLRELAAVLVRR
ncbi:thiopurine S-methyltransferase [Marinicauda salina]|uniref:Thiopurine S-methyltransferase n=1 Tax=Marinicauda salina TaxID=2135793 RepID=A0A2U2BTD9_9PROT|nr:methyltransferase domain-containing protein [Marinicauda salina]PWE17274.1 thiopurine S-methyltransferase [Marinicauda salina]